MRFINSLNINYVMKDNFDVTFVWNSILLVSDAGLHASHRNGVAWKFACYNSYTRVVLGIKDVL